MNIRFVIFAMLGALALIPAAQTQDAGEWTFRVGVHPFEPKPANHPLVHVDAAAAVTFTATYMFAPRWGLELLGAIPSDHDIRLDGAGKVAEARLLPATLSVQYCFFDPNGRIRAYLGAGLNYAAFFHEQTSGSLAGTSLDLDGSPGAAVQLGLDIDLSNTWFAGIDARWFDMDADLRMSGTDLGTVEVDPYALGVSIGRRF
jgi:outer membrane protein